MTPHNLLFPLTGELTPSSRRVRAISVPRVVRRSCNCSGFGPGSFIPIREAVSPCSKTGMLVLPAGGAEKAGRVCRSSRYSFLVRLIDTNARHPARPMGVQVSLCASSSMPHQKACGVGNVRKAFGGSRERNCRGQRVGASDRIACSGGRHDQAPDWPRFPPHPVLVNVSGERRLVRGQQDKGGG